VARDVVELFSVKEMERARSIAGRLDQLNAERQDEERRIMEEIERRLAGEPALREAFCIVIDGDGWHRGVIGITATRVVEKYGRPTLVVTREGAEAHGSGRSISSFHLLDALESCPELFSRYGGHAHAVGFALPSDNVGKLRERLDGYARSHLTLADFEPQLEFDAVLPLETASPELYRALCLLEPFGMDNPEPVFTARNVRLMSLPQPVKDKHVRLRVAPAENGAHFSAAAGAQDFTPRCHPDAAAIPKRPSQKEDQGSLGETPGWRRNVTFKAMAWGLKECCDSLQLLPGDRLDIAYTLGMNDHPEFGGLELTLLDLARSSS
jgi:single-stranded-DNA-specific exonuclease